MPGERHMKAPSGGNSGAQSLALGLLSPPAGFMKGRTVAAVLAIGAMLAACGKDSSGPSGKTTASAADPTGDTFGTGSPQWDITAFGLSRDSGGIDVSIDLTANVVSGSGGAANATVGYVEFDTDQDSTTGTGSVVDAFRPTAGSTGMGVDYYVDLFNFSGSSVSVYDASNNPVGSITPTFSGKRISFRVPRSMLGGDDAFLNAAAIVGTFAEPTDIVPNNGHLKVGGTGPVAPYRPNVARLSAPRSWGRR
jgi:hypothetical protein